jgi:hypothetical protein
MKKIYLLVLSVAIGGAAFGQSKAPSSVEDLPVNKRLKQRIDVPEVLSSSSRAGGGAIWSSDFSNPADWTHDYDPTACDIQWEIGIGLSAGGPAAIPTIESTTAGNGFAMIDSDEYGGATGGSCIEDSWLQTVDSIDLTAYSHVVVEFETYYRRWNYERPYLVVSTDGVTWPELTPDTDISGMPNVFDLWPDFPDATSLDQNPTLMRVNISSFAAYQPQVWIRFHWTGTWGYAWFIDDVKIVEQPANDLVTEYAYISHNGTGDEYGRIPQSQLLSDFSVGGGFLNFGFTDQTNCVATIDVVDAASASVMGVSANYALAMIDSTYEMDETVTPSGALATGLYEGSLVVTSDADTSGGSTFDNNTFLRNFLVTEDRYSIDGIGVHPVGYENVGSLGTNSFTDAADGMMMLAYYDISQTVAVTGLEILLSSATVPGGGIICSMHDTADVLIDDVTLPLEQTDVIDVLQEHVDAGMITVMFDDPVELEPNGYYAGVEMFSGDGASDIRILNDLTVPQPALTSVFYHPGDAVVYTNGNAAAIRLITADNVGISEVGQLAGVNIYPNPTEGILNVKFNEVDNYTVEIVNILGELIHTSTTNANTSIDLNEFGSGVFVVRVSAEDAVFNERVIVQ